MNRLTIRKSDGAWDVPLRNDDGAYIPSQEIIDRLAAYEANRQSRLKDKLDWR